MDTNSANETSSDNELWGWEEFFREIDKLLRDLDRHYELCTIDYASYAVQRLELAVSSVARLKDHLETNRAAVCIHNRYIIDGYVSDMEELLICLRALSQKWQAHEKTKEQQSELLVYRVLQEHTGSRGRPRFIITQHQLHYLRSQMFSWSSIASLIGVSRMTMYRRRQEYGMVVEPSRSLNNEQLQTVLRELRLSNPCLGEKMIIRRLRSMGYQISRSRVCECVRNADPINTALRWQGNLTARRPYTVPGPNLLWHIGM